MKPPQSRVGAIFLLSGIGRPTKANANVRGSNAAFDRGADMSDSARQATRGTRRSASRAGSRNRSQQRQEHVPDRHFSRGQAHRAARKKRSSGSGSTGRGLAGRRAEG